MSWSRVRECSVPLAESRSGSGEAPSHVGWAAPLLLVAVAASWGLSIGISKDLVRDLPVADYLGVRYALGVVVLVALRPAVLRRVDRVDLRTGFVLGLLFAFAQYIQFEGLARASIVVASFLVSLYVVFTPLLLALARRRAPSGVVTLGTALAFGGVELMSVRGWSFGTGELLTVAAALVYAVQVICVGRWSRPGRAVQLTVVQLATMSLVFLVAAAPGGHAMPTGHGWTGLTYVAIVGGTAILAQTWAQARMSAESAAIILVLEPVWASLFAVVWWGESPGLRTVIGAGLVIAAAVVVVATSARDRRKDLTARATAPVHP